MTEKLQYHDVFKTINVPKTERRLALKAKDLLDSANGLNNPDPAVFAHLSRVTNQESAAQAFWDFENDEAASYDRIAITLMRRGLTIALEHRRFDNADNNARQSLILNNGEAKVYTTDLRRGGHMDMGVVSPEAILQFKNMFLETTANLGLYHRIQRLDQNESSSATFASAA